MRGREGGGGEKAVYHRLFLPPLADICDGNMRAIYSLFYNLSHFKKMAKEGGGGSGHGEGGGGAPASRIARPISPGLKSTLSVSSSPGGSSGIPTSSKLSSPSSSSLTNGPAGGTAAAAARKGAGERDCMMSCTSICLSRCMVCGEREICCKEPSLNLQ